MINNTAPCMLTLEICNPEGSTQPDYLITPYVDANMTSTVAVIVEFSTGTCPSSMSCTTNSNFNLLVYHTPVENSNESENISNYVNTSLVSNNSPITISVTNGGFYLAFESAPSCVQISRVQVVRVCLETVHMFVRYLLAESNGNPSTGECVENAVPSENVSLEATCSPDSSFNFSSAGACECSAGYEADSNQCVGMYYPM